MKTWLTPFKMRCKSQRSDCKAHRRGYKSGILFFSCPHVQPRKQASFPPTCPAQRGISVTACDVKTGLTFVPHGCCAGWRDLKNRRNINQRTRAVCFCIPLLQSPRGGGGPFSPVLLLTAVRWGRGRASVTQNTSLSVMGGATCPKTTQGLPLNTR